MLFVGINKHMGGYIKYLTPELEKKKKKISKDFRKWWWEFLKAT